VYSVGQVSESLGHRAMSVLVAFKGEKLVKLSTHIGYGRRKYRGRDAGNPRINDTIALVFNGKDAAEQAFLVLPPAVRCP